MRPASDLADLTPAECPLLADNPAAADLIGQYNRLAGRLRCMAARVIRTNASLE